jgi:hypothetical protein
VLPGYRVDLGNNTALQNTSPSAVPRGIALIDTNAQYTLAIADTNAYNSDHFRGAASDGAGNFWGAASAEGTYYFGTNSPAATIQTTFPNTRSVDIFNGDLYCLSSTSGNAALVRFNGLPTTDAGSVTNLLPGFASANTTDFSVGPTGTLVYLTAGNSVQKWQFDGAMWTNAYNLSLGVLARYLTVDYSGPSPAVYVDTSDGRLMTFTDTGTNSPISTLVTNGVNQLFKGIRFGPSSTPPRPRLSFAVYGSDLVMSWSGSFTLVTATDVAGPYTNVVPAATSPHTNNTASSLRRFFGLR